MFERIKSAWKVMQKSFSEVGSIFGNSLNGTSINDPYRQSAWVYACVTVLMRKISSVPFIIVEREADSQGSKKEVTKGPSYDVFKKPNPLMSRSELWEFTTMAKELTGGCLWVLDVENGVAKKIWPFLQSKVSPIMKSRHLVGWLVNDGAVQLTVPVEFTVWHRKLSPNKPILGQATIEAAKTSYQTDFKASQYNESLFDNMCTPVGLISIPDLPPTDEQKRIEASWKRNHEGVLKSGGTGFLYGGAKFETTSFDMQSMQVSDMKRLYREDIFGVFGVPPAEVQVYEFANYANAVEQSKKLWENTILPMLVSLEEKIDCQYFQVHDKKLTGYFDTTNVEALKANLSEKIKDARALFEMAVPFSESNALLEIGVDTSKYPHLDKAYVPFNMVEIGGDNDEGQSNAGRSHNPNDPRKQFQEKLEQHLAAKKEKSVQNMAQQLRKNQKPHVRAMEKTTKSYFNAQRVRVQANLRDHYEDLEKVIGSKNWTDQAEHRKALEDDVASVIFDVDQETGILLTTTTTNRSEAISSGAGVMAGILEVDFTGLSPTVIEALLDREEIYRTINDLSFQRVTDAISESIELGETTNEAINRVRDLYDDMTPARSKNIAQTEIANAFNGGSFNLMKQEGIEKHRWVNSGDDRVRDSHQINEVVKIGEQFSNGRIYPDDFAERCVTVPEID